MRLVLINDRNQIEHVYEDNCTKKQIDDIFDEYTQLLTNQSQFERSQEQLDRSREQFELLRRQPMLVGANLDNFMQHHLDKFWQEFEYRKKLQDRANNWLATKSKIWGNGIETFFNNLIARIVKKKTK